VDQRAAEIVRATISLATGLGLDVVVEGVETELQANSLIGLGAHAVQGFLFAKPMAVGDLDVWLTSRAEEGSGKIVRFRRSSAAS
jgi:EAL domain-containing protein (putative c-di-GMP-specific phosphodiesterase class I)